MNKFLILVVPCFFYGCGNACDKAGDTITAKYEECGVEVEEGEEGEEAECDDKAAATAECTADCVDAADCGVIDGSNTDFTSAEWTDYSACLTDCV